MCVVHDLAEAQGEKSPCSRPIRLTTTFRGHSRGHHPPRGDPQGRKTTARRGRSIPTTVYRIASSNPLTGGDAQLCTRHAACESSGTPNRGAMGGSSPAPAPVPVFLDTTRRTLLTRPALAWFTGIRTRRDPRGQVRQRHVPRVGRTRASNPPLLQRLSDLDRLELALQGTSPSPTLALGRLR